MRRTPTEIRLAERLRIGHEYSRPDGQIWNVRQIHRVDAIAELVDPAGRRELVTFDHLLRDCTLVVATLEELAHV